MSTRTIHDPFLGKDVQVSNRLTDRLRGKYACGPLTENGEPEFGWRQHEVPPIQIEAAAHIEVLEASLRPALVELLACSMQLNARKDGSIAHAIDSIRAALAPETDKCE